MIDIYLAGGTFKGIEDWLQDHNCNKLFSYLNDKNVIERWINCKKTKPNCTSKLFIDSRGIYSLDKG